LDWYHEPPSWRIDGDTLTLTTAPQTDFWRAHTGEVHANGHFYAQPITGDFRAQVKVTGSYHSLYDQAGLMLQLDEANWLKCGIEFYQGRQHVSAVVTRHYSDWSLTPLPADPAALWLSLKREGAFIEILYALDGTTYHLLRHGYFPATERGLAGVMAASPKGPGFEARFKGLSIT
jgi:hypothetical protein